MRDQIEFGLPDVLGADRQQYASRHTLVIGSGYSAATNVVSLAKLAGEATGTAVTWVTRCDTAGTGPIRRIPHDRLPERDDLAQAANSCMNHPRSVITHWGGTMVEALGRDGNSQRLSVKFCGRRAGQFVFDRIIANVGFRPDDSLHEELQVHLCYATSGPVKLAAALRGQSSNDCLDQGSLGPSSLLNPEPNFYILGAKSYGRNSHFLVSVGLEQIRDLFTIISNRPNLDLHASVQHLVP